MRFVGADINATEINVVSLDLDTDEVSWERFEGRATGFETARAMRAIAPRASWWEDVALFAIERPSGTHRKVIYVQGLVIGALLCSIPTEIIVQEFVPANWKKLIELKGNAKKEDVLAWALGHGARSDWTEHACDALGVCLAAIKFNTPKESS